MVAIVAASARSSRQFVLASQLVPYPLSHPTSNIRIRPDAVALAANAGDPVMPVHGTDEAVVAVLLLPVILIPHVPDAQVPVLVGASLAIWALTNAVVASCVVLVVMAAVGAVGIPVSAGEAIFALRASAVVTNAVVATAVVLLPAA